MENIAEPWLNKGAAALHLRENGPVRRILQTVKMFAVIVTGEIARASNADAILRALSHLAGDFVVSVAGPAVEAQIGVIYQKDGMETAFAWIRDNLEPLFLKQEAKRKRKGKA